MKDKPNLVTFIKPVLVWQIKGALSADQRKAVSETVKKMEGGLNGWHFIVVDGCDVGEVRAFGVPEAKIEEWEELKTKLKDHLNKKP